MNDTEFRSARLALNMTQARLAERLGLCTRQVIRYEHAERTVPPMVAMSIKHMLSELQKAS